MEQWCISPLSSFPLIVSKLFLQVHVYPGSVTQILVGLLLFGSSLSAVQYLQPHKLTSDNVLNIASKAQLTGTMFMALMVRLETPFFSQV